MTAEILNVNGKNYIELNEAEEVAKFTAAKNNKEDLDPFWDEKTDYRDSILDAVNKAYDEVYNLQRKTDKNAVKYSRRKDVSKPTILSLSQFSVNDTINRYAQLISEINARLADWHSTRLQIQTLQAPAASSTTVLAHNDAGAKPPTLESVQDRVKNIKADAEAALDTHGAAGASPVVDSKRVGAHEAGTPPPAGTDSQTSTPKMDSDEEEIRRIRSAFRKVDPNGRDTPSPGATRIDDQFRSLESKTLSGARPAIIVEGSSGSSNGDSSSTSSQAGLSDTHADQVPESKISAGPSVQAIVSEASVAATRNVPYQRVNVLQMVEEFKDSTSKKVLWNETFDTRDEMLRHVNALCTELRQLRLKAGLQDAYLKPIKAEIERSCWSNMLTSTNVTNYEKVLKEMNGLHGKMKEVMRYIAQLQNSEITTHGAQNTASLQSGAHAESSAASHPVVSLPTDHANSLQAGAHQSGAGGEKAMDPQKSISKSEQEVDGGAQEAGTGRDKLKDSPESLSNKPRSDSEKNIDAARQFVRDPSDPLSEKPRSNSEQLLDRAWDEALAKMPATADTAVGGAGAAVHASGVPSTPPVEHAMVMHNAGNAVADTALVQPSSTLVTRMVDQMIGLVTKDRIDKKGTLGLVGVLQDLLATEKTVIALSHENKELRVEIRGLQNEVGAVHQDSKDLQSNNSKLKMQLKNATDSLMDVYDEVLKKLSSRMNVILPDNTQTMFTVLNKRLGTLLDKETQYNTLKTLLAPTAPVANDALVDLVHAYNQWKGDKDTRIAQLEQNRNTNLSQLLTAKSVANQVIHTADAAGAPAAGEDLVAALRTKLLALESELDAAKVDLASERQKVRRVEDDLRFARNQVQHMLNVPAQNGMIFPNNPMSARSDQTSSRSYDATHSSFDEKLVDLLEELSRL
jgi:hypothetical protein